jgi:hypothetical protein
VIVITNGMTQTARLVMLWSELWPYLVTLVIMLGLHEVLTRWERR